MKTGDIVLLSAAGKKIASNWRCKDNGFGIVETTNQRGGYPIEVKWWSEDMTSSFNTRFKRYELKKLRKRT